MRCALAVPQAREYLLKAGKPMHLSKIVEGIGKEPSKENRLSLGGSLSGYVRKGQIFTRPAPNTFGLVEFGDEDGTKEPPPEFGATVAEDDDVPPAPEDDIPPPLNENDVPP